MKFRKPRNAAFGIGLGLFILGTVLFFLIPVICKDLSYSSGKLLLDGIIELFRFNFYFGPYVALFTFLFLSVFSFFAHVIFVNVRKHSSHIVFSLFSLIILLGFTFTTSSYFLVEGTLGGMTDKFIYVIFKGVDSDLGRLLTVLVLLLDLLAAVSIAIFICLDMLGMVASKKVTDLENDLATSKEETAAAIAKAEAEAEAIREAQPNCVVAEFDPNEGIEDRREREMAFFKSCVETGYFSEYEELEFRDPIEGVTEEPVCEGDEIEERSAFMTSSSIHVDYVRK